MAERLEGASILSFAVDQWTDVPRCRHHVMSRLARQNRVLFTSPPWYVRDIHRAGTRGEGLLHEAADNLFTHTPPRWLPYTYRPAVVDRMLRRGRTLLLNRLLRRLGMSRPIVYLWHPSFADTIDGIDRRLLVYHCYDEYAAFTGSDNGAQAAAQEARVLAAADVVFTVSEGLYERKRAVNPNTHLVRNGVDYPLFAAACDPDTPIADDLRGLKGPIVGCVTRIVPEYFDAELLLEVFSRRPDWSFVVVGPACAASPALAALKALPNVRLLGRRDFAALPSYVKAFDACLIPYRLTENKLLADPLKLYEYLAAGKPVVSKPLPSLAGFSDVVSTATGAGEWIDAIDEAIHDTAPARRDERQAIAREHTWESRVSTIGGLIAETLDRQPKAPPARHGRERPALEVPPSLTTQAFWLLVAKTLGFALTLALPLLLVRTLSQTDFGLYKQAFLIVGTATTALPLGFGMSAFYFLPRERERHGSVVLNILLVHALVGALAAAVPIVWPGALSAIAGSNALAPFAAELGAVLFTWTTASFLEIVAVAQQDVRSSTVFIVASQATKTLFFIIAATTAGSLQSLLDAAILQGIVQLAVLVSYLGAKFPGFWREFDWPLLRTQASYAVPLGLSGLVLRFQNDIPHYFVAHAFGASAYAVYAVGVFNLPLVGLLRESVGSVMLPRLSRLEQAQERQHILTLLARVARKLALVYFPMYVFLMIVGPELIQLLFTDQYRDSWPIFAIYLTIVPFGVIVLDPVTRAYADQRFFLLRLRLFLFALTTLLFVTAMPQLGLRGTIAVVVAVQIAGTAAAALRLGRVMGVRRRDLSPFSVLGRIAAASLLAGLACAAIRVTAAAGFTAPATLLMCGVVYGVVYAVALFWLRVPDAGERSALGTITRRLRRTEHSLLSRTPEHGPFPRGERCSDAGDGLSMPSSPCSSPDRSTT